MDPLFYEIFEALPRQGPGDDASTQKAFGKLSDLPQHPEILDIGCGVGKQTKVLARLTSGKITALDIHPPFIETLKRNLSQAGYQDRVKCVVGDMAAMDFKDASFDLIWSEGALFIMGFEQAFKSWKRLLRPNGYLVVSDLVWFKPDAPQEVKDFFAKVDPNLKYYKDIYKLIESTGYKLVDYFPLPDESWWMNYYTPLEKVLAEKKIKYKGDPSAQAIIEPLELEKEMYKKYHAYYGYGFYIMQNRS
ncbi:MAG TPA: class I SAM-dependent methyltransferase [Candidatus Margulisiibacteriota bacterium]|nr:class I SAM-dependent methyltransferase [Candidatus Margulisiibacteriota bacterium]